MPSYEQIIDGLSDFPHKLYRILKWAPGSGDDRGFSDTREETGELHEADIIVSRIGDSTRHTIMLDLDVPATLIESSTPGHSHLYIDVPVEWEDYYALLKLLGEIGVLETGYVAVSKRNKLTSLRLPWIKKEGRDG